jgi:peptidoglycan-N-acetylglucosamine deacetylase
MKTILYSIFLVVSLSAFGAGKAKVVTSFSDPGPKKVALTFDACQSKTPAHFDTAILNYIIANKIPVSIFLSGKFALENEAQIRYLAKHYPFIEFENHSLSHNNHMDRMNDKQVIREIAENEKLVTSVTGRKPKYFRFPAGNYNQHDLELVNRLGLKVVHWTYASGDPDKHITAPALEKEVGSMTRPGNILIFHINGRGWSTGKALPVIINDLKGKGYTFVKLDEVVL